ncbi:MAG: zinc-binding dehydrogenase, partial [Chloroflexi bacterium]|nr:zinc-binding dehydrogenase [Chloroflexota bacterium]
DVMESKLDYARQLGASETINPLQADVVKNLRAVGGDGPDYVFDSVGSPTTIPQALNSVRAGGTAVVVGLHAAKVDVPISAGALVLQNKSLLGSFVGSIKPQIDLPRLIELYRAKRLPIEKLITARYTLRDLPRAFEDMESGKVARGVIVFN